MSPVVVTTTQLAHTLDGSSKRTKDIKVAEDVDFSALMLNNDLLKGLTKAGFQKPSPIQLRAIPPGRMGCDLIIQAKSGTGKTAVFVTIGLESIVLASRVAQVVVVAPTREIALQIEDVFKTIGEFMSRLKVACVIGGVSSLHEDKNKIEEAHVVVGSPGRLCKLIQTGILDLNSVRQLVLDEADELMSGDFIDNVNWLFSKLPTGKQFIVASATYPALLDDLLTRYMRTPVTIRLDSKDVQLIGIKQFFLDARPKDLDGPPNPFVHKIDSLVSLLSTLTFNQCLIFCNSQEKAKMVQERLELNKWPAVYIAGDLAQQKRNDVMKKLKKFECRILVSTDLTARGIDAQNVNLVLQFDVPHVTETYFHRIGRAGRYGGYGAAVSFIYTGNDEIKFYKMAQSANLHVKPLPVVFPNDLVDDFSFWELCPVFNFAEIVGYSMKITQPPIELLPNQSLLDESCQSDQAMMSVRRRYSPTELLLLRNTKSNCSHVAKDLYLKPDVPDVLEYVENLELNLLEPEVERFDPNCVKYDRGDLISIRKMMETCKIYDASCVVVTEPGPKVEVVAIGDLSDSPSSPLTPPDQVDVIGAIESDQPPSPADKQSINGEVDGTPRGQVLSDSADDNRSSNMSDGSGRSAERKTRTIFVRQTLEKEGRGPYVSPVSSSTGQHIIRPQMPVLESTPGLADKAMEKYRAGEALDGETFMKMLGAMEVNGTVNSAQFEPVVLPSAPIDGCFDETSSVTTPTSSTFKRVSVDELFGLVSPNKEKTEPVNESYDFIDVEDEEVATKEPIPVSDVITPISKSTRGRPILPKLSDIMASQPNVVEMDNSTTPKKSEDAAVVTSAQRRGRPILPKLTDLIGSTSTDKQALLIPSEMNIEESVSMHSLSSVSKLQKASNVMESRLLDDEVSTSETGVKSSKRVDLSKQTLPSIMDSSKMANVMERCIGDASGDMAETTAKSSTLIYSREKLLSLRPHGDKTKRSHVVKSIFIPQDVRRWVIPGYDRRGGKFSSQSRSGSGSRSHDWRRDALSRTSSLDQPAEVATIRGSVRTSTSESSISHVTEPSTSDKTSEVVVSQPPMRDYRAPLSYAAAVKKVYSSQTLMNINETMHVVHNLAELRDTIPEDIFLFGGHFHSDRTPEKNECSKSGSDYSKFQILSQPRRDVTSMRPGMSTDATENPSITPGGTPIEKRVKKKVKKTTQERRKSVDEELEAAPRNVTYEDHDHDTVPKRKSLLSEVDCLPDPTQMKKVKTTRVEYEPLKFGPDVIAETSMYDYLDFIDDSEPASVEKRSLKKSLSNFKKESESTVKKMEKKAGSQRTLPPPAEAKKIMQELEQHPVDESVFAKPEPEDPPMPMINYRTVAEIAAKILRENDVLKNVRQQELTETSVSCEKVERKPSLTVPFVVDLVEEEEDDEFVRSAGPSDTSSPSYDDLLNDFKTMQIDRKDVAPKKDEEEVSAGGIQESSIDMITPNKIDQVIVSDAEDEIPRESISTTNSVSFVYDDKLHITPAATTKPNFTPTQHMFFAQLKSYLNELNEVYEDIKERQGSDEKMDKNINFVHDMNAFLTNNVSIDNE